MKTFHHKHVKMAEEKRVHVLKLLLEIAIHFDEGLKLETFGGLGIFKGLQINHELFFTTG